MSNNAIYRPTGSASEYSEWACNFYVGCSNNCSYCYLKKGIGAKILGGRVPTLKKCFGDEDHALQVFESELSFNIIELQKHGLFFSFTTDPCLPETIKLTLKAVTICQRYDVPVKILTKMENLSNDVKYGFGFLPKRNLIAIGVTLTGHDELEPNASQTHQRIRLLKRSKELGFKTWASIEPIIDFEGSYKMIVESICFCDLFKIGLMSGKKYSQTEILTFFSAVTYTLGFLNPNAKFYFKDSFLKAAKINRADLPKNCVGRDYNIFNQ
ncbi:MAG: radical SAM protein [Lutibacter sp.]